MRFGFAALSTLCLFIATAPAAMANPTQETSQSLAHQVQMDTQSRVPTTIAGVNTTKLHAGVKSVMEEAIANADIPGGVVCIIRGSETLLLEAYGNRSLIPTTAPATLDTIYDLASLTKSLATGCAIMKLVEDGKVRLIDPINKYLPEWKNPEGRTFEKELDHETITVRHLLTHTAGLQPFIRYDALFEPGKDARQKIIDDIIQRDLEAPIGSRFIYSDLGFILLGEIVERVSGQSLSDYCKENLYDPLGLQDTMFCPDDSLLPRIAPTEVYPAKAPNEAPTVIHGEVHDENARLQLGVSGHAGLFSTASDVATFCRMLLNGGASPHTANRIFSPVTVETMTQVDKNIRNGDHGRGLGWDVSSPYTGQKGDLFTSGYGHTGFTGTSIWIVPEEKIAIVILTNRVHPNRDGNSAPLRAKIANITAASIITSYKTNNQE